ncbi:hypothetical protein ACF0H5_022134 [Mactra antiquata]
MACNYCGEDRFQNGAQLGCHVSKNHAAFACNCDKKFVTPKELLEHMESKKANEKENGCSGCCRSFDSEKALWDHKRDKQHWTSNERDTMKTKLGIHPCEDRCKRTFKTEQGLNDHKKYMAGKFADKETTCNVCTVTFGNADQKDQHKRDTGHSGKSETRRKEYIDCWYKKNVALSKEDKKESVKMVDGVIRNIMSSVAKSDDGHIYDQNVRKSGSYPTKMKIGKADEFDTQLYLNVTPDQAMAKGKVTYSYNKIDPKGGLDNNLNVKREISEQTHGQTIPHGYAALKCADGTVPAHLVHGGYLVPRAVKEDLYGKIKEATANMPDVHLNKNCHGPALTLTIVPPNGGHHISVDITPTVTSSEPARLSRPDTIKAYDADTRARIEKAGYCYVPKQNELWLVSNNSMAQEMLSKIDSGNGCRRHVGKMMKKEVTTSASRSEDGLPGVSSHIIKHHMLWCSEQEGVKNSEYWKMKNMDNCYIDSMKKLEDCLRRGKLPDYFNTSVNILAGKDRKVLNNLADHFKARVTDLVHM